MDHRTAGIPLSAVEPQNTTRENRVKRLIEQFKNQKVKQSIIQDLKQTEKINKFSKESQALIDDVNNTEKFCENSAKQQCPDCNAFWEMCLKNACMTDVHMTSPHDNHDHDHDNDHLHDTTTRVGALVPVGPGKDTHGTLGPLRRKAVGGPTPTPEMAKSRCNDASPRQHNTHVFRQTK